jgi:hypothetical protein
MFSRRGYAVLIVASAALVLASLAIVPGLTTGALEQKEARRILAIKSEYDFDTQKTIWSAVPVKVGDVRSNESLRFLSPFSRDMDDYFKLRIDHESSDVKGEFFNKAEAYSRYNLLRLPEWLGGKNNDISSFRAYSAVAISNSCLTHYWGDDGRWRIEDPCHGDMFRPWDGLAIAGPVAEGISHGMVDRTGQAALANMDLAVDSEGYIVAFKPDPAKNGVIGSGRSIDEGRSSAAMLAAASKYAGYDLPFPASITGYRLATIGPAYLPWNIVLSARPSQLAATYYGSDGRIEISSYPVDQFPNLVQGATADAPLNMTSIREIANIDLSENVTSGAGVAGKYAYIATFDRYSSAAILGEKGGRELFVGIKIDGSDPGRITALAKSLGLD